MNDDDLLLRWREDTDGHWVAEWFNRGKNAVEDLGCISEQEYFHLKLAGRLDVELHRLFCDYVVEQLYDMS